MADKLYQGVNGRILYFVIVAVVVVIKVWDVYYGGALESADLMNRFIIYKMTIAEKAVVYGALWPATEPVTYLLYYLLSFFDLSIFWFASIEYVLLLLLLVKFLYDNSVPIIVTILTLTILDSIFVVHIYRQSLMMVLMMLGSTYYAEGKKSKGVLCYLVSYLTHNTMIIFVFVFVLGRRLLVYDKRYVVARAVLSVLLFLSVFNLLNIAYIYELAVRASSVNELFERSLVIFRSYASGTDMRYAFIVSAIFSLLINKRSLLVDYYFIFAIFYLPLASTPIIGLRFGIISTSLLVGYPLGLFLYNKFLKGYKLKARHDALSIVG